MRGKNKIIDYMLSVGGNATSRQLKEAGLSPTTLKYSVDCGLIERSGRGTYVLPSSFEDEFVITQAKHSRGIFSLNTALFLFDMTDRTPNKLSMTFPRAYNVTKTQKDGIDAHRVTEKLYNEGIVNVKTKTGNTVRAYCPERTVCEVFRPLNHVERQIAKDAIIAYLDTKLPDINELLRYAKLFKVYSEIRNFLEVLL